MRSSVLAGRTGTEKPPIPGEVRVLVALHTGIVALAASGYVFTGAVTGTWVPHPLPAALLSLYAAGLAGLAGHAVWRGVKGRAAIDTASPAAFKSR